jgi:hypothetical protein
MDDDGRLLLLTDHQTGPTSFVSDDEILLIPTGVSSNPIAMTAPEPRSLAVAAFAAHRLRKRI